MSAMAINPPPSARMKLCQTEATMSGSSPESTSRYLSNSHPLKASAQVIPGTNMNGFIERRKSTR